MCIEITSTASHGKYKHYIPDERAVIHRLIYVAKNGTTWIVRYFSENIRCKSVYIRNPSPAMGFCTSLFYIDDKS